MIFRSRFAAHSGWGVRRERKTIVSSNSVISVVDDDVSVRVATDNLLSALGYIVHTFASADEFLRSAHFNDTSCVIADVQMPTMSGVELQALLLARGERMPFIFITAFPDESVRARVQKSRAICFLTKPFDRQSLIKCLDTALQRHAGGTGE
jgi:FixJ family two-component response regulator